MRWVVAVGCALAGVALVVASPNDVTYWATFFLSVPLLVVAGNVALPWWAEATGWARRATWAASFALAIGGGALYVLAPGGASYTIGGMMAMPLIVLFATAGDREPGTQEAGGPMDGRWGLP